MTTIHGSGRDGGFALLVVLLIMLILMMAGVATMMATLDLSRMGAAVNANARSLFAADQAVWEGKTWMKAHRFLAPPPRANLTSITDPGEENYYTVRNFGGIGDSDNSTAADYKSIAPDGAQGAAGPSYWYRIRIDPSGIVNPTRTAGEEAGVLVTYSYRVEAVSAFAGANQRVNLRLKQTYNLSPYGG